MGTGWASVRSTARSCRPGTPDERTHGYRDQGAQQTHDAARLEDLAFHGGDENLEAAVLGAERDDLVEDEQRSVRRAERPQAFQEVRLHPIDESRALPGRQDRVDVATRAGHQSTGVPPVHTPADVVGMPSA